MSLPARREQKPNHRPSVSATDVGKFLRHIVELRARAHSGISIRLRDSRGRVSASGKEPLWPLFPLKPECRCHWSNFWKTPSPDRLQAFLCT